jgi:arylsulfatase A-like enzyme
VPVRPGSAPPIILIFIDTLRADYLGAYGFDGPISPVLDELARDSVVFERCSSQAPWTTPSMASMMTSLYPEAHGVRLAPDDPRDQRSWRQRWTRAIPETTVTLAEILSDRGYRTAAFVANPFLVRSLGFEQGFEVFDESAALAKNRDSTALLESGAAWLREATAVGEPTFLYLHLMDVHGPYTAPEDDFEAVRESPGLGPPRVLQWNEYKRIQPYLRQPAWAKGGEQARLRHWRGRYAAGVHAVDRRLGEFVRTLRDEGLWDRQLVVVTSDHGEELFDHGGWDHGFNLHEHQLHVPLIIRFPEDRLAGTRIGNLVRLVDLTPTFAAMAGADLPPDTIGGDILPLLVDPEAEATPRLAFATSVKRHPGNTSLFDGRYKLISELRRNRLRLYDIDADPRELQDISADEPELTARLADLLRAEIRRVESGTGGDGEPGEIPEDQLERLRELGYMQ